jgi:hypothetical protein
MRETETTKLDMFSERTLEKLLKRDSMKGM